MASKALMKQGAQRRKAIVRFVGRYVSKHGHGPSVEEIAVGVGLSSKASVRHHLGQMIEEGQLVHTPHVHRSLRLPAA